MVTALARNGSRGSPIRPPKGLKTTSASSDASSVRYSANRYSSRRSATSMASGLAGLRVKGGPGGGVGSSIGGGGSPSAPEGRSFPPPSGNRAWAGRDRACAWGSGHGRDDAPAPSASAHSPD